MKTLELKLKKYVLIVDLEDDEAGFINGNYDFLCDGSELTEEIASELVELTIMYLTYGDNKHKYRSYVNYNLGFDNELESFISAVESKEKFWLENPIEKPKDYELWAKYGDYTQYGKVLTEKCLKWQEAEEKTFRNPLIFVKK
jgi:hypothetical protein